MLRRRLLLTAILGSVAAAMTVSAATATTVWAWSNGYPKWVVMPLNNTHANVRLYANARYQGTPTPAHLGRFWTIKTSITSVDFNANGGQPNGAPNSGVLDQANEIADCGPSCGAYFDIPICTDSGSGTLVTGSAEVLIGHDEDGFLKKDLSTNLACTNQGDEDGPDNEEVPPDPPPISPIILDLDRNHFHLAGPDDSVMFDIDGNGVIDELTWTKAGELDAFLVLDVNRNGIIDHGAELFGNNTWLLGGVKAPHGFIALAQYDAAISGGNEDGFIDSSDLVFADLRLWIDEDHDGIADDVELFTLEEKQIVALELDYYENSSQDQHGNKLTYTSRAWQTHGNTERPVKATDVFFVYLD